MDEALANRLGEHLNAPIGHAYGKKRENYLICPESISDPKLTIVNLARQSRKREIRADMVPRSASERLIGPAYTSRLIECIENKKNGWRPDVAARYSDSLKRCIQCINRLIKQSQSTVQYGQT